MRKHAYRTRPEGVSPVQDARLARGMTQAKLAELAGVGVLTVKRIEKGVAVSRVYAVAVHALLGLPPPVENVLVSGRTLKRSTVDRDTLPLFV